MNKIKPVLEGIYRVPSLRKKIVPIFMGDPGLGKTFLINEFKEFAQENKVNFVDFFDTISIDPKLVQYIGSQVSPLEVSGIGIPDRDSKEMVYYNYNKLASLKDGDILFFDELPNSNPAVLNALLTVINDRVMISGDKLPDVMIVAAGNWQGMSPMTPQIKRRFKWYRVKFIKSMWIKYMNTKYHMPKEIGEKLSDLIKAETFEGYNFNTPADLDDVVNMSIFEVKLPDEYRKNILPILNTMIQNPYNEDIEQDGKIILAKNEMISWLKLKHLERDYKFPKLKELLKNTSENEIILSDHRGSLLGEIKDLLTLQNMYQINESGIDLLKKGGSLLLVDKSAINVYAKLKD